MWCHIVYRKPQLGGAVTFDQRSGLRRQDWPSPSLPIGWNKTRSHAKIALQELRRAQPNISLAWFASRMPIKHNVDREHYLEAFCSANLSLVLRKRSIGSPADRDRSEFPRLDHFELFSNSLPEAIVMAAHASVRSVARKTGISGSLVITICHSRYSRQVCGCRTTPPSRCRTWS